METQPRRNVWRPAASKVRAVQVELLGCAVSAPMLSMWAMSGSCC